MGLIIPDGRSFGVDGGLHKPTMTKYNKMKNPSNRPLVTSVLMATYNGARHIEEQIESIAAPNQSCVELIVSDDGSTDDTVALAHQAESRYRLSGSRFLEGPKDGFVQNFRSLIVDGNPSGDLIAFSDQDDIWVHDKIERSEKWLKQQPSDIPCLYCGRTEIVDAGGQLTGRRSPLFVKRPCFQNALVQSLAGGNTMTMNRAAFDMLRESLRYGSPVSHDWWTYILVSGVGGHVYYDPHPLVLYRQHGENLMGENQSFAAKRARLQMMFSGTWSHWNDVNIGLLLHNPDWLTEPNRLILERFIQSRQSGPMQRLGLLKKSGLYRQTLKDTVSMYIASALNRL